MWRPTTRTDTGPTTKPNTVPTTRTTSGAGAHLTFGPVSEKNNGPLAGTTSGPAAASSVSCHPGFLKAQLINYQDNHWTAGGSVRWTNTNGPQAGASGEPTTLTLQELRHGIKGFPPELWMTEDVTYRRTSPRFLFHSKDTYRPYRWGGGRRGL